MHDVMPGLVPGIHVFATSVKGKAWMAGTSPAMAIEFLTYAPKILFIIFVDAIFTTLFECLFTNSFDAGRKKPGNPCVYPPRITD